MTRAEIKKWAKLKIKGKMWNVLGVSLIAGLINGISTTSSSESDIEVLIIELIISFVCGILAMIIDVGLIRWMTNFINDKETKIEMLFSKFKDWKQVTMVFIHQFAMVLLYTLLLIIPGMIKALGYSLVPYILANDSNMGSDEVLKLSEKMMKGHKMDLFIFSLSFIGWHLLAIFTLGILEIWIIPYQETATTKYLLDIKAEYENNNQTQNNKKLEVI